MLPPYIDLSLPQDGIQGIPLIVIEAIQGKHQDEDIRLLGHVLQSNSSNYLVLTLGRQLEQFAYYRGTYGLTAQHICKTLYK